MPSPASPSSRYPTLPPGEKRRCARFPAFLPVRCRLRVSSGERLGLEGKTRNLGEGGLLLLLPRALRQGVPLTVEFDTQMGPAARPGRVVWVGQPERTELGGTVIPHWIAFGQPLERTFVERVVTQGAPGDPRAPVEVQVDYATVASGHSVNLSRSGIFIRTAHPLPVNSRLTLRFSVPGIADPFEVQGLVIWSNPRAGQTYPQGMGVKLVGLPKEREEKIGAFVAQVRREQGLERAADLFGRPQEAQG